MEKSSFWRKIRRLGKTLSVLAFIGFFLLTGCQNLIPPRAEWAASGSQAVAVESVPQVTSSTTSAPTEPEKSRVARIGMVGDILMHDAVLNGGEQPDGTYNYDYMFKYVAPEAEKLDYAIFDMEGTLAESGFSGYPLFAAPDAIAQALKNAGFDCAITANNHMLDRRTAGIKRTNAVIQGMGMDTVGSRKSVDDPTFLLKDLNGIKVAISAYTYETVRQGEHRETPGLNGIPMSEEDVALIDSFSQQTTPEDFTTASKEKMAQRIQEMKAASPDLLVFIMHWGREYSTNPAPWDRRYAQFLANQGVDLVFACGPHVINPIETVPSEDGSHNMLCFYSVGNFLSDQTFSTEDSNGYAEDGLFATVTIEKQPNQKARIRDAGYIAYYNHKNRISNDPMRNLDHPVPINLGIANPSNYLPDITELPKLLTDAKARVENVMSRNAVTHIPIHAYDTFPDQVEPSSDGELTES